LFLKKGGGSVKVFLCFAIYLMNFLPFDTNNKCKKSYTVNLTNSHMTGIEVVALEAESAGNPSQPSCERIWVHRESIIVGRFLFAYFIFYTKNAEVPVGVLVANDSSQDFRLCAKYNVHVAAVRVHP